MIEELSKPVLVYLVLSFLYISIFFIKNVTCDIIWYISLNLWFDFYVSIFCTIFLYLSLCEMCPNMDFFLVRFPAFGLNTERYDVSLRIQSECGKIRARKKSIFGHFSRSVCIRRNLSFVLNHERDYLKIYDVFHFSDIQCYVIFSRENGVFLNLYPWIQTLCRKKNPGMLFTVGFQILSRLWISNFIC